MRVAIFCHRNRKEKQQCYAMYTINFTNFFLNFLIWQIVISAMPLLLEPLVALFLL